MSHAERWQFSFRFDRRGLTSLWELAAYEAPKALTASEISVEELNFEARDDRLVWIKVIRELPSDHDLEVEFEEAKEQARRFFERNYPEASLLV